MGVKSLWKLLEPVGRPVMLEVVEGKTMAIDSSIWIYQFQATMRDKDGRALVNAHVLGFLRRICKLLFYGIKPVFVFDGGAPALKRATIIERKKKKSGAAAGHAQLAEKLLAAHMRREALNHASARQASKDSKGKGKAPAGPVSIDENIVYLEDIDNSVPITPTRKAKPKPTATPSPSKKNRFHDHDPYRLPDVDLGEAFAEASRSGPDPRLATEEELRAFIEDMRPEDLDVTSPEFRELPTEVQYEIIGDLRLKSRQTSYRRLQTMLRNAPTPLDFSKQQIKNLKQRNALTQQLLTTTDSVGKAHISIPVRIASERNKEYILVKNDAEDGGWILGIRDDGTQENPIEVDKDDNDDREVNGDDGDGDDDMEEVSIPQASIPDPDLREHRQEMALSAIATRGSPNKSTSHAKTIPLFDLSDEEFSPTVDVANGDFIGSDDDGELAAVIQASMDDFSKNRDRSSSPVMLLPSDEKSVHGHEFEISTPLKTALSFANAGPSRLIPTTSSPSRTADHSGARNPPISPFAHHPPPKSSPSDDVRLVDTIPLAQDLVEDSDDDMEEVVTLPLQAPTIVLSSSPEIEDDERATLLKHTSISPPDEFGPSSEIFQEVFDQELNNFQSVSDTPPSAIRHTGNSGIIDLSNVPSRELSSSPEILGETWSSPSKPRPMSGDHHQDTSQSDTLTTMHIPEPRQGLPNTIASTSSDPLPIVISDSESKPVSRSPSPALETFVPSRSPSPDVEDWDAAQEIDPAAEEGDFAEFVSKVKGKDIDDVRREIDDEIKLLNHQKKLALRDSEEITQQMVTQIMMMLRLFGIPYITAPMEAEAQCATLVSLGLVEGVITDDSDVFLFGGLRVYKNMFNQSKTVECFFSRDLERELGLDRNTLIRLAYLLGSDYVEGLPGVGVVTAMEILEEFPGDNGLHKFKEWWSRVQTGKDTGADSKSTFRQKFKKKFKNLYLEKDWPNSAVRDAYLHPTVDDSEEPFKWGLPDLDGLRQFFGEELGWPQKKVDELILPVIQRMRKRNEETALNKQGNLNEFFDVTAGSGTYPPRRRQAYASKRLQQIVSGYRRKQVRLDSQGPDDTEPLSDQEAEEPPKKKMKGVKGSRKKPVDGNSKRVTRSTTRKKPKDSNKVEKPPVPEVVSSSSEEYVGENVAVEEPLNVQLRPRPKPKPTYRASATT